MRIIINEEYCKGCNFCIEFCPTTVFESSKFLNKKGVYPPVPVYIEKCVECGICELFCPDFAIILEKGEK